MKTIIKIETIAELIDATRNVRLEGDNSPTLREFVVEHDTIKLSPKQRDDYIIPIVDFQEFAVAFMQMHGLTITFKEDIQE